MSNIERVGEVWVEAGMVLIGDPCYLIPEDDGNPRHDALANWATFCSTVRTVETAGGSAQPIGAGLGIVISDFGGDGTYPVDIVRDECGTVQKVIITFSEDDEDDWDKESWDW